MSPQVVHALKQAGIMIALAVLGVMATEYTGILQQADVNPLFLPIIGSVLAGAVRWFEGMKDSERAKKGEIVKADVGFAFAKAETKKTPEYEYPVLVDGGNTVITRHNP
jgi:hypothetical protein